jgi:hypothetical protein
MGSKLIDLTGKKFGKWLVIERLPNGDSGRVTWLCVCECGLKKPVDGSSLKSGVSKGCRDCKARSQEKTDGERVKPKKITEKKFNKDGTKHGNFNDLSGKTFYRWKVLRLDESQINGNYWICECDCGAIRSIITSNLTRGISKGCYKCSSYSRRKDPNERVWRSIERMAALRNIKISISKDKVFNLLKLQNKKCALSGIDIEIAPTINERRIGKNTASLDRIDSNKGYEINNVQWIHKDVNKMKMDFDQDHFINFCCMIAKEYEKRKSLQENTLQ